MKDNAIDNKQDPEPGQNNMTGSQPRPEQGQNNMTGSQPGPDPGQVSYPEPNISCYI